MELETTCLQLLMDQTAFYPIQNLEQKGGMQGVTTQQGYASWDEDNIMSDFCATYTAKHLVHA